MVEDDGVRQPRVEFVRAEDQRQRARQRREQVVEGGEEERRKCLDAVREVEDAGRKRWRSEAWLPGSS